MICSVSRLVRVGGIAVVCGMLSACGASSPAGTGFASAGGSSCELLRKEMNVLISRGVAGQIEAQQAGRKLSAQNQAQVARYNAALEGYLGQQCQNR